jgi:hypothetical protein
VFSSDEEPDNADGLVRRKATEPFSESVAAYTNRDRYSRDAVAKKTQNSLKLHCPD